MSKKGDRRNEKGYRRSAASAAYFIYNDLGDSFTAKFIPLCGQQGFGSVFI